MLKNPARNDYAKNDGVLTTVNADVDVGAAEIDVRCECCPRAVLEPDIVSRSEASKGDCG